MQLLIYFISNQIPYFVDFMLLIVSSKVFPTTLSTSSTSTCFIYSEYYNIIAYLLPVIIDIIPNFLVSHMITHISWVLAFHNSCHSGLMVRCSGLAICCFDIL